MELDDLNCAINSSMKHLVQKTSQLYWAIILFKIEDSTKQTD